jgi:ubiquinone biosynthesis protein COQ4
MTTRTSSSDPAAATVVPFTVPPPPTPPTIEWRRAWRAMRRLMANPEETEQAFEAISALSGHDFERLFQRFVAHPDGRALYLARPSLLDALSDRAALRALPAGSFGRAYAEFMDAAGLDAQGLVDAELKSEASARFDGIDPDREWFGDRLRDMHDLWHVLTGYGRDEAGEAANLAFTFGQTPFRGIALILFGIAVNSPPEGMRRRRWLTYLYRAWKRGRSAAWLPTASYEQLLPRPLEEVRQLLRIRPASGVHPEGVIVSSVYGQGIGVATAGATAAG